MSFLMAPCFDLCRHNQWIMSWSVRVLNFNEIRVVCSASYFACALIWDSDVIPKLPIFSSSFIMWQCQLYIPRISPDLVKPRTQRLKSLSIPFLWLGCPKFCSGRPVKAGLKAR